MRRIDIRVLGPFEVRIDGAPVTGFAYAKVRALLAYLAVEPPRPHPRAALAALLWPEQPEAKARASLSQALLTLRTALGDKGAAEPLLLADTQHVGLNPRCAVVVDATELRAALAAAEAHPHRSWRTCADCAARLRQALAWYRGSFLADVSLPDSAEFEEWAALCRGQLLQGALSGLERLVERAAWCGAGAEAVAYARQLVALDPLLEGGQRTLMRLLAESGAAAAALAQYRQLQTLLAQELGAEPEDATTALYEQIRSGALVGAQPAPPPVAAALPPTPLVGRSEALQAIHTRLRDAAGRLLTITGAGGIGKTRLALEAAHALRCAFEDGVYLVELAALNDTALLTAAIARALGIKERLQQPLRETLRETLRTRHLLLILDNFEHMLTAAPLVAELLAACPALYVLVTSRAPLMIRAEQQLTLEPLADAEAVQLFLQRAEAVGARLAPDEGTAIYTAICRRLDRLPLAIELIAVRARALTPRELLQQLEQPLEALTGAARDVDPRHQSLRHAIRWSYDLLDAEEQRVFRALGVFVGGCTADAAQTVVGPGLAVLPVLEALHRASLMQRQVVAEQTRFVLLETIREFALEQLARCGELAGAEQRHAEHFAQFAMAAYDELLRAEAPRWGAWIAAEQANLRAAFRRAQASQLHETALRIATGAWRFHYHYRLGSRREGLEQLEAALAHRELAPLELQGNALRAAGTLAGGLNDYPRARRWFEAAVEAGWRMGDQRGLQMALNNFGYTLREQGELEEARLYLEVSLSLARRAADPSVAKFPLGILAGLFVRLGDYKQAQAMSEEGLRINQARQDPEGTADALRTLAIIRLAQGHQADARRLGEEALSLHRTLSHQYGMGLDYALLGDVAQAQGAYAEALAHYQQSLSLWQDREHMLDSAVVLDHVAQALSRLGDPARAVTLLSAAAAIREQTHAKLTDGEQAGCDLTIRACRSAIGPAAFTEAWAAGRGLTLAQAVALALGALAHADGSPQPRAVALGG